MEDRTTLPPHGPLPPGGLARLRILRPLRIRDFALLWSGATVSLVGDGMYVVALAWQVYELSNSPTALSLVGVAWTVPMAVFLLFGGIVGDRFDRRRVMILADVLRGVPVLIAGVLSVTGTIELWHLFVLSAVFGTGEAFFGPAFSAIVPQIVPRDLLLQANSVDGFIRPFAFRLAGPAIGGLTVASLGPGEAFLLDAASFAFSALMILFMRPRPIEREREASSARSELREGFSFVRAHTWLWGTLLAAAVGLLAWWGPTEVLIPFRVKNELGGDADDFGYVFAAGGVGSIVAALALGQFGLPRRHITFMYAAWGLGLFLMAGFGLATALWQMFAVSFVQSAVFTAGLIVWRTMMQALVPTSLLGRVTSLDWLVSTSLVPVSFALTGPVADGIGAEATLLWAGAFAGVVTLACYFLPGMLDTERSGVLKNKKC